MKHVFRGKAVFKIGDKVVQELDDAEVTFFTATATQRTDRDGVVHDILSSGTCEITISDNKEKTENT